MTFPIVHRNERDVEVPMLLRVAGEMCGKVASYLDVGACYSHATYAGAMRQVLGGVVYHACDPVFCQGTREIVDAYFEDDIRDLVADDQCYGLVSCISVLEHVGIQTKQLSKTLRDERIRFFSRLINLTKERLIVTFPFGVYERCETYANLTSMNMSDFIANAHHMGLTDISTKFFFNEGPQLGHEWVEISEEFAEEVRIVPRLGVRCVCIFDAKRVSNGS